jgi:hypothetical protein
MKQLADAMGFKMGNGRSEGGTFECSHAGICLTDGYRKYELLAVG